MKICTITCQNADNHGARLQAYALAIYLKRLGHEVEIIDYRPPYMTFTTRKWYWPGISLKDWVKLFWQYNQRVVSIRRHKAFERFSIKYLPLTKEIYGNIDLLRNNPPQADVYIVGSDQVWNTTFQNGKDEAYYLDFGSNQTKRISYAASFATKKLASGTENFVREKLRRLDAISVREESGISILKSLGYDGQVVIDPTLLLSCVEWDKLLDIPKITGRYILVYDFMRSKRVKRIAQRLAKLYQCNIYSIGARHLSYANKCFVEEGPEYFVGLIKNAVCVVSNSFHGTIFSMIYQKNFFVILREDGLNDRMSDWLVQCGLLDRMIGDDVSDEVLCRSIDYERPYIGLKKMAEKSKEYIEKFL